MKKLAAQNMQSSSSDSILIESIIGARKIRFSD